MALSPKRPTPARMPIINGGPIMQGGRFWQKNAPLSLSIDPSCKTVPALRDPGVEAVLKEAYRRSIAPGLRNGVAEHGFHVAQNPGSRTFSPGPIITSGLQESIDGAKIDSHRPKNSVLFAHTHPNRRPPSGISKDDRRVATHLGIPVAALDGSGRIYCALPDMQPGKKR